jgi:uncharacterized membrane protein
VVGPPLSTPFYNCAYYQPTPNEAITIYVGYAALGTAGAWHAAKLEIIGGANGGLTDLGPGPGGTSSQALSLNTQGLIVGSGDSNDTRRLDGLCCAEHALIWGEAGSNVAMVLPSLGAGDAGIQADALAINDTGEVVGWSEAELADGSFAHRATLWSPNSANACSSAAAYCAYQLDRLLAPGSPSVVLTEANAINCAGDIAARMTSPGPTAPETIEHDYLLVRQGAPRNCTGPSPPLKRQLRGVNRLRRG